MKLKLLSNDNYLKNVSEYIIIIIKEAINILFSH